MSYFWLKSLHLLFVIAWMAAVFYLPRILVNVAETRGQDAVQQRLFLMGTRLYRFGHVMFGLMLVFGMVLWMVFKISGGWLHAKLGLVGLLFAYFIWTGIWLKKTAAGGSLPSSKMLRLYNEAPILLALGAIYLVIAKPF